MKQDTFHVERVLDGRIKIVCTSPIMVVPPDVGMQMATAILQMLGVEVVFANPGQTIIAPPRRIGNGHG